MENLCYSQKPVELNEPLRQLWNGKCNGREEINEGKMTRMTERESRAQLYFLENLQRHLLM